MTRLSWMILFRDGFDDLTPLQAVLARYGEPLQQHWSKLPRSSVTYDDAEVRSRRQFAQVTF